MSMEQDLTLLRYILRKIYHAETRMKKLKSWMIFDFFSDSLILNFFKRRQISNTTWDYIFDLWLDNAVVDFMIYKNVQDISKHLDALKSVVVRLIKQQLN